MEKQNNQLIFPISFDEFVDYQHKKQLNLRATFNLHEYTKIRKLKKMLQQTQHKVHNRIKLFKKVSQQIHKKKQKENLVDQRKKKLRTQEHERYSTNVLAQPRNNKFKSNQLIIESSKKSKNNYIKTDTQKSNKAIVNQSIPPKLIIIKEERKANVRDIKIEKQRYRIIVEQMRNKEMRKKMQSADTIRKNRYRVKEIKNELAKERMQEARRIKQSKFKEQVEQYDELQANLLKLQQEQKQALIMWKKAIEE